jgi:hypothetical protein
MKVDIEKLVKEELQLEAYFILYCLHFKKEDVLVNYLKNVLKINKSIFDSIVEEGYLKYFGNPGGDYTLENIQITNKFGKIFFDEDEGELTFEKAFEELREVYPKKTPDGRRLHVDLDRCEKYYRSSIISFKKVNKSYHNLIIECTKFIVKEKTNNNSLQYLLQLPTYLNKKEWQTVEDDVKKLISNGSSVNIAINNENKKLIGTEDF